MVRSRLLPLIALALTGGARAANAANIALSSDGASFVSGSSAISVSGYNDAIGGANLLTATPTPAYYNGDVRYIFGGGMGSVQTLEVKLGALSELDAFSASFDTIDRAPQGPFAVSVSLNGSTFTPVVGVSANAPGLFGLTTSAPVSALYVEYNVGPPSSQYSYGGSGVFRVYANAVPEPATWAMLLAGFGLVGGVHRSRRAGNRAIA